MAVLSRLANRDRRQALGASAWVALALMLFGSPIRRAESAISKEYQVKAVFLLNFARFVDWPPEAFPEPNTPFVIGVLGDDPFGAVLDEIVANEAINGHPVIVRRFRDVQEISLCHILYVSGSEVARLTRILGALGPRPILTVGDARAFAANNGVIQFVLVENRIRLRINVAAARAAKLSISSQLLRQAQLVESK